jgi:hypothetical protein
MRSLIKERLLEAGSFGPICQHRQMGRLERLFEELRATEIRQALLWASSRQRLRPLGLWHFCLQGWARTDY